MEVSNLISSDKYVPKGFEIDQTSYGEISNEEGSLLLTELCFSGDWDSHELLDSGKSKVHLAAMLGNIPVLQWCKSKGHCMNEEASDPLRKTPFLYAIQNGHFESAKWIYWNSSEPIDLSIQKDSEGTTAAMYAVDGSFIEILQWLYDIGGNAVLEQADNDGNYIVHRTTTTNESMSILEWLYSLGFDLDKPNHKLMTPLLYAIASGNLEMVQWFSTHGCSLDWRDIYGHSAMIVAVVNDHDHILQWLLDDCKHSVSDVDFIGRTPLHHACMNGSIKCCRMLIDYGADILIEDSSSYSPIMLASKFSRTECVKLLIWEGADINSSHSAHGFTLLMGSIATCNIELLRWLVENGADTKLRTNIGNTATTMACGIDKTLTCLKMLIELDSELLLDEDVRGNDLAMCASRFGAFETLKWLMSLKEFCMKRKNFSGVTIFGAAAIAGHIDILKWIHDSKFPLEHDAITMCFVHAAGKGHIHIIEWLIDNMGFSVHSVSQSDQSQVENRENSKRHQNVTPLMVAAAGGQIRCLKWLCDRGGNIGDQDSKGNTAIFWAAKHSHIEAMKWLLKHGASLNQLNARGKSPFDVAQKYRKFETASWISSMLE